jgi:hypothetical protein
MNIKFKNHIILFVFFFVYHNIGYSQITVKEIDTEENITLWERKSDNIYSLVTAKRVSLDCISINRKIYSNYNFVFECEKNYNGFSSYHSIQLEDLKTTKEFVNLLLNVYKYKKSFEINIKGKIYILKPTEYNVEISTNLEISTIKTGVTGNERKISIVIYSAEIQELIKKINQL